MKPVERNENRTDWEKNAERKVLLFHFGVFDGKDRERDSRRIEPEKKCHAPE